MSNTLTELDPRLITVQIQVGSNIVSFTQDYYIRARGAKFANPQQNECDIDIGNLDSETRNYILTETSPFNKARTQKTLSLLVGRVSTGLFSIYTGNIATSRVTQPPDITLRLKCGTQHAAKGKVGKRSGGKSSKKSVIAGAIASDMGLSLRNESTDEAIANYQHSGNLLDEHKKLHNPGKTDCYVDDSHLVLKDSAVPLKGSTLQLSQDSGMVGIPEVTEKGLRVKFLFDSSVVLGGGLQITSKLNPAANGLFVIQKLRFAFASREKDFYYIAECLKAKGT